MPTATPIPYTDAERDAGPYDLDAPGPAIGHDHAGGPVPILA